MATDGEDLVEVCEAVPGVSEDFIEVGTRLLNAETSCGGFSLVTSIELVNKINRHTGLHSDHHLSAVITLEPDESDLLAVLIAEVFKGRYECLHDGVSLVITKP